MKAVSSKRKKTDADHDELARLEWFAGLYRTDNDLVIPAHVLESALVAGAKKSKRGVQAKSGLFIAEHAPMSFTGKPDQINDNTLAELFDSGSFTFTCGVRVGTAKVMRTRPMFKDWSLLVSIQYDPDVLNSRDIEEIVTDAGRQVGIGDWRPKYGRFTATPVTDTPVIPDSVPQMLLAV